MSQQLHNLITSPYFWEYVLMAMGIGLLTAIALAAAGKLFLECCNIWIKNGHDERLKRLEALAEKGGAA